MSARRSCRTVVLVTGAAPYLGGAATWLALRNAAPEIDFVEIDTLDFAALRNLDEAAALLSARLRDADAIVAHYSVAKLAIDVVAREHPTKPVVLLSPLLITRSSPALRVVRTLLGYPPGGWILNAVARAKHRRLLEDRSYVVRQLKLFLGDDVSERLLEDAQTRLRDPRCGRIVDRTSEFLRIGLTPVDTAARTVLANCAILVGRSRLDRKTAKRFPVTVLTQVDAAPMLQAPASVAAALRDALAPVVANER